MTQQPGEDSPTKPIIAPATIPTGPPNTPIAAPANLTVSWELSGTSTDIRA